MATIYCPTCGRILGKVKASTPEPIFVLCKKCRPIAVDKIEQKMGRSIKDLIRMEERELGE